MLKYFKSIIDSDKAAIVVCSLEHEIIYMNPSAIEQYSKRGGVNLIGRSLFGCHNTESIDKVERVIAWFRESKDNNLVYTFHNEKQNKDGYMVALRDSDDNLIGYYEKHEYRNPETMKMYDI